MAIASTGAQQAVEVHFDEVAPDYDHWKKKNWYYYDTLYSVARRYARNVTNLLDVGCGTGSMILAVAPKKAVGIDVSHGMLEVARRAGAAHTEYVFTEADIATFTSNERFDVILFFDVIEHLTDVPRAFRTMHDLLTDKGELVLSMANPLWEPILMFAERRGLKMPEGPHVRLSERSTLKIAKEAGLTLKKREWHLLFPKYIPFVSWFINRVVGALPFIRRLAVIEIFVFTRA
jgi:2-polyprenyl-3-methyl-5-hydroxy-6-metoxy-1,4-benzoquinol methylase